MADKAKHAFGLEENVDAALEAGVIDARDILFLNSGDNAKIGWIDKDGNKVIVKKTVLEVDALPTADGENGVIYLYENEAYIWDGTECKPLTQDVDVTELQEQIDTKVDASTVQSMIEEYNVSYVEIVEF